MATGLLNARLSRSMPAKKTTPWTLAELKQLGRTPDSVLARRTGRTIKEVVAERERRRIGLRTPRRRWTAREINLLGNLSDMEVARRLGRDRRGDGRVGVAEDVDAVVAHGV